MWGSLAMHDSVRARDRSKSVEPVMDRKEVTMVAEERARRKRSTMLRATPWYIGAGILLATTAFSTGCATSRHFPSTIFVWGFDFRTYTEAGFLFTPEAYDGPYESVALLTVTMYPEVTYRSQTLDSGHGVGHWVAEPVDVNAGIAKMYEQAVEMGADAVMRFSVRTIKGPPAPIKADGFEITGFAIRRQQR